MKCSSILEMFNIAFGESVMSKTRVYECCKHFQEGCENIDNDGCPKTSGTNDNAGS